jgi:hypothetical protein
MEIDLFSGAAGGRRPQASPGVLYRNRVSNSTDEKGTRGGSRDVPAAHLVRKTSAQKRGLKKARSKKERPKKEIK